MTATVCQPVATATKFPVFSGWVQLGCGFFSVGTTGPSKTNLTGMRHFLKDLYPDFDANRAHPLVSSTIWGSKKARADPVVRKLPLCLAHLQSFLNVAHCTGTYNDFMFIVLLTCTFYGCHRMGELVQKNDRSLFDWRKIIKRASLTFESWHAQYCLPYHKGDPFYRGSDVIVTTQDVTDPVSLLWNYIQLRDGLHGAKAALFLCEDGTHPTHSWFELKFFAVLEHQVGGHSPCTGYATFLASLGIAESIIQAVGQWSLEAWKIYIERILWLGSNSN